MLLRSHDSGNDVQNTNWSKESYISFSSNKPFGEVSLIEFWCGELSVKLMTVEPKCPFISRWWSFGLANPIFLHHTWGKWRTLYGNYMNIDGAVSSLHSHVGAIDSVCITKVFNSPRDNDGLSSKKNLSLWVHNFVSFASFASFASCQTGIHDIPEYIVTEVSIMRYKILSQYIRVIACSNTYAWYTNFSQSWDTRLSQYTLLMSFCDWFHALIYPFRYY